MPHIIGILLYLILILAAAIGYVLNIYALFTTNLPLLEFTIVELLRIIGIFLFPLGALLGYF